MANRSMEAKRQKIKRMKRLAPKRYSSDYIPVGTGPNTCVLSEYRARTLSLSFDAKYLATLEAKQKFHGVPPGKVEIRGKLREWQAEGFQDKIGFAIISDCYQKVMIYRNSENTKFRIVQEDFREKCFRWSIIYPSKSHALAAWNKDKVTWIEKRSIPDH